MCLKSKLLYPKNKKSPTRKVGELDSRGSHFYLAMYWAEALANQSKDPELKSQFEPIAKALLDHETKIVDELNAAQGNPVNIKGYYFPNESVVFDEMRPSKTFNEILSKI